jgi:tRNA A37 threonylcarbamoyladenosine biosynthesis protein TsaE
VRDPVTSPSFTIGQVYSGRVPVAHVDLFRLENLTGEDPALLADYLTPDRVTFIEWPGAGVTELDRERVVLELTLAHGGGERRLVEARGQESLVDAIRAALGQP